MNSNWAASTIQRKVMINIILTWQYFRIRNIARTQWYKINSNWAAPTIQRKAMTKNNIDLDIFQCECPMKLCSLLLSTVSHFWCIGNGSAPQFCATLSGMMTNCAELHYSFTSTAWIWCKVMLDCAKERRLEVGIRCKTVPDCANERRIDVESTDVLDITLWQNKQQLSGFHYSEKSNDKK